jgi:hypothetical protein
MSTPATSTNRPADKENRGSRQPLRMAHASQRVAGPRRYRHGRKIGYNYTSNSYKRFYLLFACPHNASRSQYPTRMKEEDMAMTRTMGFPAMQVFVSCERIGGSDALATCLDKPVTA